MLVFKPFKGYKKELFQYSCHSYIALKYNTHYISNSPRIYELRSNLSQKEFLIFFN